MSVVFQILGDCIVIPRHQPSPLELTGSSADNVSDAVDRFQIVELGSAKVQSEPLGHIKLTRDTLWEIKLGCH